MPRYSVTLPIVGSVSVEVEADNEEMALAAALESDIDFKDVDQWEVLRRRCRGNVCSLPCDTDVREIDANDD